MARQPPEQLTIRWCPACGQTDLRRTRGEQAHKSADGEKWEWCYAVPQTVTYERKGEK